MVAAVLAVVVPLAALTATGERLAFHDGDLVLVRSSWWGAREQVVGMIDGGGGCWWITKPGGRPEPYVMPSGGWSRVPSP